MLLIRRITQRFRKKPVLSYLVRRKTRVSYPRSYHRGMILLERARQQIKAGETYPGGFDNGKDE